MSVLSRATDIDSLAIGFCEHVFKFFSLDRIGLLERENNSLSAVTGFCKGEGEVLSVSDLGLSAAEFRQIDTLLTSGSSHAILAQQVSNQQQAVGTYCIGR